MTSADGGTADEAVVGQLREELSAAQDEVRRSPERLELIVGQLCHDLRGPLTAVSMSLQMLEAQPSVGADDEARWMVERALVGVERMDAMIGQLVDYAQRRDDPSLTEVDLGQVTAEVANELVELETAALVVGELPVVNADPVQVRVLLRNLLSNAAKFTRTDTPATIHVSGRRTHTGWRVEVADDGPGVPADERERVFELFTRLDKRVGGAGIGLATCRRIAEANGGSIGMAASPDGGALVWVELPAR